MGARRYKFYLRVLILSLASERSEGSLEKKKGFTHKGLIIHKALTVLKTRILVLKKLKADWSKFGIITVLIKIISPPMGVNEDTNFIILMSLGITLYFI
jgi:hypothetical protein